MVCLNPLLWNIVEIVQKQPVVFLKHHKVGVGRM